MSVITKNKQNSKALTLANEKKFHQEKESVLLKNLELGMANYNNGNYCQASDYFNNASEISKEQYTYIISKAITSSVSGGFDIYYEPMYEKSLMRFYQSLANYNIYKKGECEKYSNTKTGTKMINHNLSGKKLTDQEKNIAFASSKANALEWRQWLDNEAKDDILQKVWDAFLAEEDGNNFQLQKAKILYENIKQDAKDRGRYFKHNEQLVNDVVKYAEKQLKRLKNNKKANFGIVIFDNVISEKKAGENISVGGTIGSAILDLSTFITSPSIFVLAKAIGYNIPKITYELPFIEKKKHNSYSYKIYNSKNEVISNQKITLIEPVSDMAFKNLEEKLPSIMAKKVLAAETSFTAATMAINTAYLASMSNAEKLGKNALRLAVQGVATVIAIGSFHLAVNMIKKIMVADTRQWVSVPSDIFFTIDKLPKGEYEIELFVNNKSLQKQPLIIQDDKMNFIEIRN